MSIGEVKESLFDAEGLMHSEANSKQGDMTNDLIYLIEKKQNTFESLDVLEEPLPPWISQDHLQPFGDSYDKILSPYSPLAGKLESKTFEVLDNSE